MRYQTVFAQAPGSVAAPTAGLHFTPRRSCAEFRTLFSRCMSVSAHFVPVKAERIADHTMHEEHYEISPAAASAINGASRLVAVGTTSARVLESQPPGPVAPRTGSTAIFIHPPKTLSRVGALLTISTCPESTLLMLGLRHGRTGTHAGGL